MESVRKMKMKTVSGTMLTLLLISMLTLAFNIQSVEASGTIYISSDYTFTSNIYEPIVVTADNIIIDGAGYTVQGTGSGTGINMTWRSNVTLKNVEVTNFTYGIYLNSSSNNTLTGNNASNNEYGIYLDYSSNNVLAGNNASNNLYNFGVFGYDFSDFNNYVDTSNTVDGKPIYYLIGVADTVYDAKTNAGTIYLINSNNITIKDLTLTKNYCGALFFNTTNSKIENVTASNNYIGILLYSSSNNTLAGNTASNNFYGIPLSGSSNNVLAGNTASNNEYGTYLALSSNNNVLAGNNASNNYMGIPLYFSSNNTLAGNTASNNQYGIHLSSSSNNTLTGNNASNNYMGIALFYSSKDVLAGNTASNNTIGIHLYESSNNVLFHNNLISNTVQASVTTGYVNTWDDGYPSGGNYWSNYAGVDVKSGPNQNQPGSDGIGDTAYIIDGNNRDNYPLMYPWSAPAPPSYNLTIYSSPTGVTVTVDGVPLTTPWLGTYSEDASVSLVMPETHDGYVWSHWLEDGDPNRIKTVTMDTNITLTALFTPDTTPPSISIVSPENKTYPVEDVPLTFTVSEPTSWMGYSLDGQANVTIAGNTTLSGLLDGSHLVVVYANDTAGNMGTSSTVYFTVDTTPPNIIDVSQTPLEDNVLQEDEVKVNATVTDDLSGVKQVFLNYTNGNGAWFTVEMTNLVGNVWNATIPAFPYGTNVTCRIIAEDNMNNTITTEDLGYEYQYTVIPEFPTWTSMLLILILLTVAIAICKRKLIKTPIQ